MEIPIIAIGNSKGIRIPKTYLDKYNMMSVVDITFEEDKIVLRAVKNPRDGWDKSFKRMNENADDRLLINDVFEDENLEEW